VRYLIDAMNVIGSRGDGWWRDRHDAMSKLVASLDRWSVECDGEVTVVFESPPSPPITSDAIEVTCAPEAHPDSADQEILRRLRCETDRTGVCVITSDHGLSAQARELGAQVRPASAFRSALDALDNS
jgi:uncharacterized protein YaiI (UPF0178 family)